MSTSTCLVTSKFKPYFDLKNFDSAGEKDVNVLIQKFFSLELNIDFDDLKKALYFNSMDSKHKEFPAGRFADYLCHYFTFITFKDSKEVYVFNYESGLYEEAEPFISSVVKLFVSYNIKQNKINETITSIKASSYINRKDYEPPLELTPIQNGIINTKTGELTSFSEKFFFIRKIHVTFNPVAICPNISNFIDTVLPNEKDRETWYYMTAYCLIRNHNIQKMFVNVGGGSNGKSTANALLTRFLGSDCVANKTIQDLSGTNRFSISSLYQRYANIFSDLPKGSLKSTGMLKALTGGDWLSADVKFQVPFDFQNHAKLIFSANELPRTEDETDAFFRRFIILEWNVTFTEATAKTNLLETITTEEELSGLLNLILDKVKEMSNSSYFKFPSETTMDETRTKYLLKSNPIGAFALERCLTIDDDYGQNGLLQARVLDNEVTTSSVYNAYLSYCKEKKFSSARKDVFGKFFLKEVQVEEVRRNVNKLQVRYYRGILVVEDKKKAINENKYEVPKYKASDEESVEEDVQGKLIDLTKEEDNNALE